MPTTDPPSAYQDFSPAVYQRLRESLMRQSYLFDWVATEADITGEPEVNWNADAIARINNLANSPADWPAQNQQTASKSSLKKNARADRTLDNARLHSSDIDQFVLMEQAGWHVLLTALVSTDASKREQTYRVGLFFGNEAIVQFAKQLQASLQAHLHPPHPISPLSASRQYLNQQRSTNGRSSPSYRLADQFKSHLPHPYSRQGGAPISDDSSASTEQKRMTQETFILSWAKQMMTSPEEEEKEQAQRSADDLQTQIRQSLLRDQVVTQIRHSLDLSDILETTVSQVREFLAADRLVLYQFEQQGSVAPPDRPEGSAPDRADSSRKVNRSVTSGNITYEALASEEIVSVLNATEKRCFTPSRLQQAKFLSGRPIAVDSVDEQYAHADCLLNFLKQAQVKSKIIAPVVVQGELWGLLIAHQCQDYRQWKETEVVFLQHIADHLAVAISQAQLYHRLRMQTTSLESCVVERSQNLHDALMAAETANVTKGEFLSTMSHELRTPLTYIIGMSATLLRWSFGDLSDRQRSYLNTINQSGEQLLGIINNILEFAKVESGQRLLEVSEVSLSALFDEAIAHYSKFAQQRGVTLSLDFKVKPDRDLFWADSDRLRQIVANLTENAIKFTPEGGQVNLLAWQDAKTLVFQIEDTGIGIADSQRDGLFEKFKQLASPFQRQHSGTGLGLAMTKHLVEMHGGVIEVDSKVNQGSTFTVRLPVQPKPKHDQQGEIFSRFTNAKRIVLLEQHEERAAIICNMLTAAGYEVIWLLNADALVAQLDLLKPMMLIANLSLLNAKVHDIKALQLSIATLDTKVLALLEPKSELLPMAHHDVLAKPVDPKTLLEKVRQLSTVLP